MRVLNILPEKEVCPEHLDKSSIMSIDLRNNVFKTCDSFHWTDRSSRKKCSGFTYGEVSTPQSPNEPLITALKAIIGNCHLSL